MHSYFPLTLKIFFCLCFVVLLLSHVWLFVTPCTAAHQASLSFTISWSFSNSCTLIWWCHPTSSASVAPFFSRPQSFPVNRLFVSGGQSIGTSASASVLPMNIQGWFPLGLTTLISLQSKGLSQESSPAPQFKSISSSVGSNCHIHTCCCCCC